MSIESDRLASTFANSETDQDILFEEVGKEGRFDGIEVIQL
jgi:hypothetical protein